MSAWTDPAWLATAHEWIDEQLERLGIETTGAIEQPHVRPWSTVLRVPTGDGPLWFKANVPLNAYEAGVVSVLARLRSDCVPALVAADLERGWMLMGDAGVRLRELIEEERDLGRWLDVLPLYAGLQIDAAPHAGELVALGAPDRRLVTLPSQYQGLLDELGTRGPVERIAEMCEELAAYGIRETIQHDDFHDAQVFVRDGGYVFFDWGDSCVSHPFFTMSVTLEGQISWGLDDVEGSEDITRYRAAYLAPFRHADDLEPALEIALRLGWICRALNWHRFATALESPHREEYLEGVALRLRMFASRLA